MTTARSTAWTRAGTASAMVLRPMLDFARSRGVDVDAILRAIDLPASALGEFDRQISEASRSQAWRMAAEQASDTYFGLEVAKHAHIGAYDVLDYALYFSRTLGEALDRILRFHSVLCDAWGMAREEAGESVRLRRVERTPPAEAEASFAFLVLRARELTGQPLVAHGVSFAHSAPADTRPYAELFGGTVRFACPANELEFSARALTLPVRTANPGVVEVLDRYMTEYLSRLPKNASFVELVRSAVARTLHHGARPDLHATARELHTSARTLQRRLLDHGTSHSAIVDSLRRNLAERLVADRRVSVTEAAFLTGFSDVSGFRRMYKRWTGRAPAQHRVRA